MKELNLLIWVTQLGFSIAAPLALCIIGTVWLRDRFQLGNWIILLGIVIGIYCAVDGFIRNLKVLNQMGNKKSAHSSDGSEKEEQMIGFNSHD